MLDTIVLERALYGVLQDRAVARGGYASAWTKRTIDVAITIALLPIVLPLLMLCVVAVKLDSPGPVLFSQLRVGTGGKRFRMLKLRTMQHGVAAVRPTVDPALFSGDVDQRVTRVGRYLRTTGLDELPQLFHVLTGDMSLVGPRPMQIRAGAMPLWHTARLEAVPGITGLVQVSGRETLSDDERIRFDIAYLRTRSIGLDLSILVQTLSVVARGTLPIVKRTVDVVGSLILLCVLSPLLLALCVLVRATSPGPAVFGQVRVGIYGRPFTMYKFRTMRSDAQHMLETDPALHAAYIANDFKLPLDTDPRITTVGRWLRRTSLDELPQLYNVLCGDMSLVGPRPIVPAELVHYGSSGRQLCSVPPGMTGAWQAFGRSEIRYPERCEIELSYVRSWSLTTDIEILLRTVGIVVSGRGAT
jgi:lipopolysaccharide/colanic/teichoic acid biosynthesis glycosyltransferase